MIVSAILLEKASVDVDTVSAVVVPDGAPVVATVPATVLEETEIEAEEVALSVTVLETAPEED